MKTPSLFPFSAVFILVFLSSCVSIGFPGNFAEAVSIGLSISEQWDAGHIVADSPDGVLTVIGVSSRQAQRRGNELSPYEVELAKDNAARKVAMFHSIGGTVESFHRQGAGFFDFIAESLISIQSAVTDHTQFIRRLTFDPEHDAVVFTGGTLIRFRYTASVSTIDFARAAAAGSRPGWVDNPNLHLAGYATAVGFSRNQVWFRDTMMRATEAAAARLIKGMNTTIETVTVDIAGTGTLTYITSRSYGTMERFRVVEFWIDPRTMSVYALGIARLVK